jgi:hypothetical protein
MTPLDIRFALSTSRTRVGLTCHVRERTCSQGSQVSGRCLSGYLFRKTSKLSRAQGT